MRTGCEVKAIETSQPRALTGHRSWLPANRDLPTGTIVLARRPWRKGICVRTLSAVVAAPDSHRQWETAGRSTKQGARKNDCL
ncbi:hypothetical protein FAGKG844_290005 [Frankia sp. AgKG'84/4]